MAEPFLGEIRVFALNFEPRGWARCDGRLLPIAQHDALFVLLGTTYGGDGVQTFALPDLRGRAPMGSGAGPGLTRRVQGEQLGVEEVVLGVGAMPAHTHGLGACVAPATEVLPTHHHPAEPDEDAYGLPADVAMAPSESVGGGQPHTNLPPSLVVNFMIALEGIFPARN